MSFDNQVFKLEFAIGAFVFDVFQADVVQIVGRIHGFHHPALWRVYVHREYGRLGHVVKVGQRLDYPRYVATKANFALKNVPVKAFEWRCGKFVLAVEVNNQVDVGCLREHFEDCRYFLGMTRQRVQNDHYVEVGQVFAFWLHIYNALIRERAENELIEHFNELTLMS